LTNAQTNLARIEEIIQSGSASSQIDEIKWNAKTAYRQFELATEEAYIAQNTREEKLKIIDNEVAIGLLTAEAQKENINLTKAQIQQISEQVAMGWENVAQNWGNLSESQRANTIKELELQLREKMPTVSQVGGAFIKEGITNTFKFFNDVGRFLKGR